MAGIWRWATHLPQLEDVNRVSLGEGDTPLIDVSASFSDRFNGARVLLKCEHLNPSGSFKDRVAAVAASLVLERGLAGAIGTSSGNGGAALAAYAAAAGFPAILLTLPDAPHGKLRQITATGGRVQPFEGLGHDAAGTLAVAQTITSIAAERRWLAFLTGARFSPEIMRGAETIAFELAEQSAEATAVYAPVGGGGLVASLSRGYGRLDSRRPALRAVQPAGNPTVRASLDDAGSSSVDKSSTALSGLQVAVLFDDVRTALAEPRDGLVEIEDDDARQAQADLARVGILVEPAGACALAGALREADLYDDGDTVVLIATGAGWKTPDDFDSSHHVESPPLRSVGEVGALLDAVSPRGTARRTR
ncbi:pyridoxal-phosphate dependent enzyme [Microbacterium sp. NPDC087592]|uniref:pyridoxal-phosphate dependent enzyme n=1 Tax=Microbacterium sp. NPDC087592 TaxID=3364193 RepID=UPI003819D6EB